MDFTDRALIEPLVEAYYKPQELDDDTVSHTATWVRRYCERVQRDGTAHEQRRRNMNAVNPKYVLRNYLAQLAIDKAQEGDFSMVNELLEILRHPYEEQPGQESFAREAPRMGPSPCGLLDALVQLLKPVTLVYPRHRPALSQAHEAPSPAVRQFPRLHGLEPSTGSLQTLCGCTSSRGSTWFPSRMVPPMPLA